MPYAEHLIAVISEDPERVGLVQRSFARIASHIRVVHVDDANGALRLSVPDDHALPEQRPVPHLIVLDGWPGERSIKALKRIRAAQAIADVRVIVLCRSNSSADVGHAYRLGANSCLTVCADTDEFVTTMEEAARYWLLLNRWPA